MPRSNGVYTEPSGTKGVTGEAIDSAAYNAYVDDLKAAITGTLARDGSAPPTANIPMNSKKLTGLEDGTAAQDSVTFSQMNGAIQTQINAATQPVFGGKLEVNAATLLQLTPYSGDKHTVPDGAGGWTVLDISSFPTVSNAGLSAFTIAYCYLFDDDGTATLELSSTVPTDSQGAKVKTGDVTRLLVGVVFPDGSAQFVDSITQRWTRSWYNESGVVVFSESATSTALPAGVAAEWSAGAIVDVLLMPGDHLQVHGGFTIVGASASICQGAGSLYQSGSKVTIDSFDSAVNTSFGNPSIVYATEVGSFVRQYYRFGFYYLGAAGNASNGVLSGIVTR